MIKGMGAKKINRAIEMASRAVGGSNQIVENFDYMVYRDGHSTSHNHASSSKGEEKISCDLHSLKLFAIKPK